MPLTCEYCWIRNIRYCIPSKGLATEMQSSPNDVSAAFIDHTVFGALAGYIVKYAQAQNQSKNDSNLAYHSYPGFVLSMIFKTSKNDSVTLPLSFHFKCVS